MSSLYIRGLIAEHPRLPDTLLRSIWQAIRSDLAAVGATRTLGGRYDTRLNYDWTDPVPSMDMGTLTPLP
jgi:hypothetical protein